MIPKARHIIRSIWRVKAARFLAYACICLGIASGIALSIPLPSRLGLKDSVLVRYRDGLAAYAFLSPDDRWRIEASPASVDPDYLRALVAYEDRRFWFHPGIDPGAIARALMQNLRAGRVVSGASTLTMQLVRILEPRKRTLGSKLIEALRALQLELRLSKSDILGAYLRFAPFGRNIEGVEAASLAYFGHGARDLSPMEIAYLVSVPQDPNHRYPSAENTGKMKNAVRHVAGKLRDAGVFSDHDLEQALHERLPSKLKRFPRALPHAAVWLKQANPNQAFIDTTLDRATQTKAERIMRSYYRQLQTMGIHNGSAVVIEQHTGKVRALVGNFDFFDQHHHGQVPGFLGLRSPGSTLKPFIFALSIDRGIRLPSYLLQDVPVSYGSYEPHNYDEQYRGLARFDEALVLSLNVPAVNLLNRVGLDPFLSFLETAGLTSLRDKDRYGLSAAIGGLETNLLELTNLYAVLARGGSVLPWSVNPNTSQDCAHTLQVLSPGACYLIREILRSNDRPDFPHRKDIARAISQVFWKTGTSYGHKDAWAIGADSEHTVGVWLGNFEGKPSVHLVGGERAGPLLFDILESVGSSNNRSARIDIAPGDLTRVEVCALSGRLPTKHCPTRTLQGALLRNLPIETCSMHIQLEVDRETGYALCPLCRKGRDFIRKTFTRLPTAVQRWIKDENLLGLSPPGHLPTCQHVTSRGKLQITQPQNNTTIILVENLDPAQQEIPLEVDASDHHGDVFWYVNGRLHARAAVSQRVWLKPEVGDFEISVLDDAGRGDRVTIRIRPL